MIQDKAFTTQRKNQDTAILVEIHPHPGRTVPNPQYCLWTGWYRELVLPREQIMSFFLNCQKVLTPTWIDENDWNQWKFYYWINVARILLTHRKLSKSMFLNTTLKPVLPNVHPTKIKAWKERWQGNMTRFFTLKMYIL